MGNPIFIIVCRIAPYEVSKEKKSYQTYQTFAFFLNTLNQRNISVKDLCNDILICIIFCFLQRVLQHQEDSSLLKAYIAEWGKFFTQCDYLPKPFMQLVTSLAGKPHGSVQQKKTQGEESLVRKVRERETERGGGEERER